MMNPAKVLISAMPLMAIPAIAQGQQYLMHEDGGTNYSVCYTGVFYDHKPKWQQLTAFPIYKLFWCSNLGGAVENCEDIEHSEAGFCSQDACESQKQREKGWDTSSLHCAAQYKVDGTWQVQ
jgi:hypothetical protein